MYLSFPFALFLGGSALAAPFHLDSRNAVEGHPARTRACGTFISPEEMEAAEMKFQRQRVLPAGRGSSTNATLDVYFHVIAANHTIEGGWVPDEQIATQIDVLNRDYNNTGISWHLVNTTRIINPEWFEKLGPDTPEEKIVKLLFRTGNSSALNVFTTGFKTGSGKGLLGYATFPFDYENNPTIDGIIILYSTLPGGSSARFNEGRTLTHESGHWAGLYHTFQGGCEGVGDSVDDTPAEASPAFGCPATRNTCSEEHSDPTHNFMDYVDDSCMQEFTPGQAARLQAQLRTYRGVNI